MNGFVSKIAKTFVAFAFALTMTPIGAAFAYAEQTDASDSVVREASVGFVYFGSTELEVGERQQIAVSLDDDTASLVSAVLTCMSPDGDEFTVDSQACAGSAALFEFDVAQLGEYALVAVDGMLGDGESVRIDLSSGEDESRIFAVTSSQPSVFSRSAEPQSLSVAEEDTQDVSFYALSDEGDLLSAQSMEGARSLSAASTGDARATSFVVALDPGHGGSDSGASSNGVNESDVNWKIAQYCKAELESRSGLTVYVTRSQDECPGLTERVERAVANGANIFVSIHINSYDNPTAHGAEVWIPNDSSYNASTHTQGQMLGEKILEQLVALGLSDRGVKTRSSSQYTYPDGKAADYYTVINSARQHNIPGIIVEHCFITNAEENAKLRDESFLQSLGVADATGIVDAYDLGAGNWQKQSNGKWKYRLADGSYAKSEWRLIGAWYYFDGDGYAVTGLQTIDGKKYYFDSSCAMETGWKLMDGKWYYFNPSGDMAVGWTQVGNNRYYLDPSSGVMKTGWQKIDGKWYWFDGSGAMAHGWVKLGAWYYLDPATGAMATGITKVGSNIYYLGGPDDGSMKSGWQKVDGKWYHFGESWDGSARKGWTWLGAWYYLDPSTGAMATGITKVGSNIYYLGGPDDGSMKSGWQKVDGKWYHFGESWDGSARKGWAWLGAWYYLDPSTGVMQTGMLDEGGKTYYLGGADDGSMKTGWVKLDNKWYWFDGSGAMAHGWIKPGAWYYLDPSTGVMQTGWEKINDTWYYLGSADDGSMKSGWQWIGNTWYYLGGPNDGAMKTGWLQLGDIWYYLKPSDGGMVTGQYEIAGKQHYFANSGVWIGEGSPIMGSPKVSVDTMVAGYAKSKRDYPSYLQTHGGAPDIEAFCQIIYDEAVAEGVRPEVVWAQIMNETGFLQFGGDVSIEQFNYGGIGATGNGVAGNSFADVREGIRVQVQHLKAYACTEPLNNVCVDPRFSYVSRGCAPLVQSLGGKWAASTQYGFSLVSEYMMPFLGVQ